MKYETGRITIDHRRPRADMLAAAVMMEIEPFIADDQHHRVSDALRKLFWRQGVEIITDVDRALAGLSPRGNDGMTSEELHIIEARRMQAMLGPAPPFVVEKDSI